MDTLEVRKRTIYDIQSDNQIEKYKADNTYKLKLSTTHALNYTPANGTATAHGGSLSNAMADQNGFGPYWNIPELGSSHIKKCWLRITSVTIPSSTYSFACVNEDSVTDYNTPIGSNALFYIECDKVINKSYVSYKQAIVTDGDDHIISGEGGINLRPVLGTYNYSSLIKARDTIDTITKASIIVDHVVTSKNNMSDNDWIECENPFGGTINLNLRLPDDYSRPIIKSSVDAREGDAVSGGDPSTNLLLNAPIIYELEIKLIPDLTQNDRFNY